MESPIIKLKSSLSVDDAVAAVEAATVSAGFGIQARHDVNATMAKKGVEFESSVRIIEMCEPNFAKSMLSLDINIAAAMPCRISIYAKDGQTYLATIAPQAMLTMFDAADGADVANAVQDVLVGIMEKAC
ncbi:MAG TPA: DUF302 domain-containing protein [Planctomycetes bacterium]|jgi:uncharacterized protein (DUF302 family)|nr:DUF302 domain-containing protein [Planctomycetota bacterium]